MQPGLTLNLLFMAWIDMETLEKRYTGDPELLACYKEKLLIPGWAGQLDKFELAYVKSEVMKSPSLKRRWGLKPSAKRVSNKHIRQIARDGLRRNEG